MVAQRKGLVSMHAQSPRRSRRKRYPREASGSSSIMERCDYWVMRCKRTTYNAVVDEIRKDVEVGQFHSEVKFQGTRSGAAHYERRGRAPRGHTPAVQDGAVPGANGSGSGICQVGRFDRAETPHAPD